MTRLNELQTAHIKRTIKSILILRPLPIQQVISLVGKKLMPNIPLSGEDKRLIEKLTAELIFEGQLNAKDKKIELNGRYRVSSVEEDYKLDEQESSNRKSLNMSGGKTIETVGSERYPFIWQKLNVGENVDVELIPEPTNMRDPLAVAVCIDKKPYAYLPREEAARYHPTLTEAKRLGYNVFVTAEVTMVKSLLDFKMFKLNVETPEKFSEMINAIHE